MKKFPSFAYVSLRLAPPPLSRAPRCSRCSHRDPSTDGPGPPTGVPAMLRERQAGGQVLRIRIVLVVVARDSRPRAKQPAPRLEARRPLLSVPGQHDFAQVFHRPKLLVVLGRPRLVKDPADRLLQRQFKGHLGLVLEPSVPPRFAPAVHGVAHVFAPAHHDASVVRHRADVRAPVVRAGTLLNLLEMELLFFPVLAVVRLAAVEADDGGQL